MATLEEVWRILSFVRASSFHALFVGRWGSTVVSSQVPASTMTALRKVAIPVFLHWGSKVLLLISNIRNLGLSSSNMKNFGHSGVTSGYTMVCNLLRANFCNQSSF